MDEANLKLAAGSWISPAYVAQVGGLQGVALFLRFIGISRPLVGW